MFNVLSNKCTKLASVCGLCRGDENKASGIPNLGTRWRRVFMFELYLTPGQTASGFIWYKSEHCKPLCSSTVRMLAADRSDLAHLCWSVPAGTPLPATKYKIAGGHGQTLLIIIIIIIIINLLSFFLICPYTIYRKYGNRKKSSSWRQI